MEIIIKKINHVNAPQSCKQFDKRWFRVWVIEAIVSTKPMKHENQFWCDKLATKYPLRPIGTANCNKQIPLGMLQIALSEVWDVMPQE